LIAGIFAGHHIHQNKASEQQENWSQLPWGSVHKTEQKGRPRGFDNKMRNNRISLPEAMEARAVSEIPRGRQWQYEPKWDGFRCLLGRFQNAVAMRSKSGQDLARYFPEIAAAAVTLPERDYVLDGELVIPTKRGFSFDGLLQRIHPAEIRIRRLAVETPALFVAFDLLMRNGSDLAGMKLSDRRPELEDFAKKCFAPNSTFRLSPSSTNLTDAQRWLTAVGGTDGVMAKRLDLPYQEGNREGMQKIKMHRTADCVIGGFRYGERPQSAGKRLVGSLLLGLYDDESSLHHVGFTSGIKAAEKRGLTDKLEKIRAERSFTGNAPGTPSRWSTNRSTEWIPVRPKFVLEVSYDHISGGRFRHGTTIVRWRPDKKPKQCTMQQLKMPGRGIRL
jgi:ATP-dependent DNA ligase